MTKPKGRHSVLRLVGPAPALPKIDERWRTSLFILLGIVLGSIAVMVLFEPYLNPLFVVLLAARLGMLGISLIAFAWAVQYGLSVCAWRKRTQRVARVEAARESTLWDEPMDGNENSVKGRWPSCTLQTGPTVVAMNNGAERGGNMRVRRLLVAYSVSAILVVSAWITEPSLDQTDTLLKIGTSTLFFIMTSVIAWGLGLGNGREEIRRVRQETHRPPPGDSSLWDRDVDG